MANDIREELSRYSDKYTAEESTLLKKINRETHLEVYHSNMLSGHVQGRFLSLLSRLKHPRTILEIGTFTGYSAVCLAEGLQEGGKLFTIDNNDELAERCKSYFKEAGLEEKIVPYTGDAAEVIPTLPGPFDLVFIDADKPNYSRYFDLVIDKVPKDGLIIADNVLYHGEVLLPPEKQSKNGKAIASFNKKVHTDERVVPLMLDVRDGLYIMQKR